MHAPNSRMIELPPASTSSGITALVTKKKAMSDRIGTISSATMLMILISGLTAGPAVSLYGSPTVSPVTAALWASLPLPPKWPSSMYFLALSQAPPPVHIEMATNRPVTMVPISMPPSAAGPEQQAHQHRRDHRQQRRHDHLLDGRRGQHVDGLAVLGLARCRP